jgi:hypothetical protein
VQQRRPPPTTLDLFHPQQIAVFFGVCVEGEACSRSLLSQPLNLTLGFLTNNNDNNNKKTSKKKILVKTDAPQIKKKR